MDLETKNITVIMHSANLSDILTPPGSREESSKGLHVHLQKEYTNLFTAPVIKEGCISFI